MMEDCLSFECPELCPIISAEETHTPPITYSDIHWMNDTTIMSN